MKKQILNIITCVALFGLFTQCDTMNSKSKDKAATDKTLKVENQLTGNLSAASSYDINEPIMVTFTVENSSDKTIKFTQYSTPFEGFLGDFLEIKDENGAKVNYIGAMARRIMPPPADTFIEIPPHEKKAVEFDIRKGYKMDKKGTYTLKFINGETNGITSGDAIKITLTGELDATLANTLLIMVSKDTPLQQIIDVANAYGATISHRYDALHGLAIKLPANIKSDDAIIHFKKQKGVLSVEKDQVNTIQK